MMNKKQFTKIAKDLLKPDKVMQGPAIMHPMREWLVGMLLALIIFAAGSAWSTYVYIKHEDPSSDNFNVNDEKVLVYREAMVSSAIERFSQRNESHVIFLNSVKEIVIEDVPENLPEEEPLIERATTTPSFDKEEVVELEP